MSFQNQFLYKRSFSVFGSVRFPYLETSACRIWKRPLFVFGTCEYEHDGEPYFNLYTMLLWMLKRALGMYSNVSRG